VGGSKQGQNNDMIAGNGSCIISTMRRTARSCLRFRAKLTTTCGDMPPGADKSASGSDMSSTKRRPHGGGVPQRETDTAVESMAKTTLRRRFVKPILLQNASL
jgi:hypothetical protein